MHIPTVVFNENSGLFCGNNIPGMTHALHTCTSAAQLTTRGTSRASRACLIPTQDPGWAPKRDAQESSHLDATRPFPSFPPALAGLCLPQGHSRADQPCTSQGLRSAPTRENPRLGASNLADTLRKAMPDPPDTKAQHKNLLLALLSCQAHPDPHGNLTTEQLLRGDREMLALPSLGAEHCPRSHTQFGNFRLSQVLCIRMAESSEIVS